MSTITVVGSMNMDIVLQVDAFPKPGETIAGKGTKMNPGGKGANQAVAAARLGGNVKMLGAIGEDSFSEQLLHSLKKDQIQINDIVQKNSTSGLAFITVAENGDNHIVLEEGANGELTVEDVRERLDFTNKNQTILLQNEIPWNVNECIIKEASANQIPVYLNPAPAKEIPSELYPLLTGIFLNESEANMLTGVEVRDRHSVQEAIDILLQRGTEEVIITMGKDGAYYADNSGEFFHTTASDVRVVDTTAAGDTFIGAYLVMFTEGKSPKERIEFSSKAAGITVTRSGAQESIPRMGEVQL
ncbi:ribokinase [Gracilibacillus sp. YIM 98692]|uniref:ribokinase n=1 Tax=Gracilibacillus sp. YIM 98692 TaxID=2663532 RepID=UPI0013D66F32|nr:ribokinase [Gracilibacillus sp. YIM 98692]